MARARAWAVAAKLEFGNWDPKATKSITVTVKTNKKNVDELFDFVCKLNDPKIVASKRVDDKEIEITLQMVGA